MRYVIEMPLSTKLVFTVDADNAEEAKARAIASTKGRPGCTLFLRAELPWFRKHDYENMDFEVDNFANKAIVDSAQIELDPVCSRIWEECKENWEKVYGYRTDLTPPDMESDPSELLGEQKALLALYHKKVDAYLASNSLRSGC